MIGIIIFTIIAFGVLIGIPLSMEVLPVILDNHANNIDDWKTLPGGYKQVIVTFEEFHKYYMVNPDAYKLTTEFDTHPIRDDFIFQFSTYREWKKYQKWLENDMAFEKNHNSEEAFSDIVQADLDIMQEKHIKWLEERKKEFEEQRRKLSGEEGSP